MNADRLLHAFSMIGEDPARIQQLRQVAVALAIAGKLCADPSALSPREMLRAVEQVKAELYKQRAIPKPKNLKSTEQDELPENFPDAGRFAPLGRLARVEKGLTGIKQAQPGPFPLVVTGADRATCDHFDFNGASAIVPLVSSTGHGHASLNRLHYQEGKFALGTILAAVFPYDPALMSARFIFEYLSAFKEELLVTRMTGTANVTLSVGRIAEVPVPLIDPTTQAKVDELMALLDRLEAARTAREATRDRLTAASLARLTAPDPEASSGKVGTGFPSGSANNEDTFPANARFALATLPALTTRPDQIKPLRQTILNLAVRGKLVAQDPIDEPASELLKRIAAEKARLVKAKAIRKPKVVSPLDADDLPFPLPRGWAWTQIAELGIISPRNEAADDLEASFVPMPMIAAEYGVANGHEPRPWGEIKKGYTHFAEGDVGLAKITPCFENGKSTVFRNLNGGIGAGTTELHIVRPLFVDADYIVLFLKSPQFIETGIPRMTGTAGQKRVPTEYFTSSPFPLPPLAEQHRIVAKVDALMALSDRLEAALTTAETTRARLLEALLHEALDPAVAAVTEAAE